MSKLNQIAISDKSGLCWRPFWCKYSFWGLVEIKVIFIFRHMYLCLHILALLGLFVVPHVIPPVPRKDGMANGNPKPIKNHITKTPEKPNSANGVCNNHHD